MLVDKYNMTMEENILYAKRNIVDSIWKSAKLEGIPVTFPETQAIFAPTKACMLSINFKLNSAFILKIIYRQACFKLFIA